MNTCKELKEYIKGCNEIKILGTTYHLEQYDRTEREDTALGTCDFWKKIIYIDFDWYEKAEEHGTASINRALKTIRHEIVHAFMYEMGNEDDAYNERIADALAIQTTQFTDLMALFIDRPTDQESL